MNHAVGDEDVGNDHSRAVHKHRPVLNRDFHALATQRRERHVP